MSTKQNDILILMPTKHIGDLLICLRTIEAIQQSGRFNHFKLVADDRYRIILEMASSTIPVLFYPRAEMAKVSNLGKIKIFSRFVRQLRGHKYQQAIDLDGTILSARICRMVRADQKIGPQFSKRPGVYNQPIDVNTDSHKFFDYTQLLAALNISAPEPGYPKLHSDVNPDQLSQKLNLSRNQNIVCLHTGATKFYKQWGFDKFAALADQIIDSGWQCVFIGAGKIDRDSIAEISARMKHQAINSCDQLNLKELVLLLELANVYVGNDSGPMHLSAATGTRTIGLFGPTSDTRWRPLGDNSTVIRGVEDCASDCRRSTCSQAYRCMKSLDSNAVFSAITTT